MSFPIRFPNQLTQHLRALRKRRGLTQAQLGSMVGVKQARIAEIETNPGAVSLDQLTKLLAALQGTLHLHVVDAPAPQPAQSAAETTASKKGRRNLPPSRETRVVGDSSRNRKIVEAAKSVPSPLVVIRAKKGQW